MARPKTEADPETLAKALDLLAAGDPDGACKLSGLSLRTLYRRRDEAAEKATSTPSSPTSDVVQLPQGGAVSTRPDVLELCRRILKARNPDALAELDEGIMVQARGEQDLAEWLARPLASTTHRDPLEAAIAGLDAAVAHAERLSPLHPKTATVLGAVASLASRVEAIGKGRPRPIPRDEVTEAIINRRDVAVDRMMVLIPEARAKLEAERAGLEAWAAQELPPRALAELRDRVAKMLGAGAP